jgi:transcriptional regulator with XRE-family HTH domain
VFVAIDGPRARALRETRGMSRRELAEVAGLAKPTLRGVEKRANVRRRRARNVAAAFGLRPRELGRPVLHR